VRFRRTIAALAVGAAATSVAWAATIRSLDVTKEKGRYALVADTFVEAPADAIFAVLIDYDHFNRISSVYKEYGYLEPAPDGTPIVYTRMEGCLMRGFFCTSMRRVERLETKEPHFIRTVTLPEQSDFHYATSEWLLEPQPGGTQVTYKLEMEPDFWVPPVIGPWFLKRKLMDGGVRAVNRIERLARALDDVGAASSRDSTEDSVGAASSRHSSPPAPNAPRDPG
jgi:hypothetical protein